MTTRTTRTRAAVPGYPTSIAAFKARGHGAAQASGTLGDDAAQASKTRALRSYFAVAAKKDTRSSDYHRVVADVLARADRVDEPFLREWSSLLGLLERHRANPKAVINCGVLANLVGIAAFGDAADFAALDGLTRRLGSERVATVQHRAARFVEPDPTFPLTTIAIRQLVAASRIDAAVALLHEGIDADEFLPVVTTHAQLLGVIEDGSVLEWRHHLSMIVASPWSPYARHLIDLSEKIDHPLAAVLIEQFTEVCRDRNKEHEREQVAEEVRRLVSASGITQRQFAKWVGTSPSRLSSYVSGSVTPSASLMLRMARTSRLLQARDVPKAPLTLSEESWGAAWAAVEGQGSEAADPAERAVGTLGRDRSHLSAV